MTNDKLQWIKQNIEDCLAAKREHGIEPSRITVHPKLYGELGGAVASFGVTVYTEDYYPIDCITVE